MKSSCNKSIRRPVPVFFFFPNKLNKKIRFQIAPKLRLYQTIYSHLLPEQQNTQIRLITQIGYVKYKFINYHNWYIIRSLFIPGILYESSIMKKKWISREVWYLIVIVTGLAYLPDLLDHRSLSLTKSVTIGYRIFKNKISKGSYTELAWL